MADSWWNARSNNEQVDEIVHWSRLESCRIERQIEDRALLFGRKTPGQVGLEFLDEYRNALLAAAAVADGIFDDHFLEPSAIDELDGNRVGDGAFVRVEVVLRELLVLDTDHLGAEAVDARILRDGILVIGRGEAAENKLDGDHVLNA